MIIKKFEGKTEGDALEKAKKELGNNVVIMNVKKNKKKGFLGFFSSGTVEITVALEEEEVLLTPKPLSALEKVEREAPAKAQSLPLDTSIIIPETIPESPKRPIREEVNIEKKLENLQNLIEKQLVKEEAEDIDEEMTDEKSKQMASYMKLIYKTLLENEVNEKYANQFMDEIEKMNTPGTNIDTVLVNIYQKMILKFGTPSLLTPAKSGPKLVFFIGPTGVGKTTTIAKIASKFSTEEKKEIALITADTYRIAAAEQLRTYANILNVPFRIIYSAEEIESAWRDFQKLDYIFVDTAGFSPHSEEQKKHMENFVHAMDGKAEQEIYLVLSATTKYKDLLFTSEAYFSICKYKLIFTKLDETSTYGNLLNLKLHTGADLSYVTYGQSVPDDIRPFNPQSTVKNLLGGK